MNQLILRRVQQQTFVFYKQYAILVAVISVLSVCVIPSTLTFAGSPQPPLLDHLPPAVDDQVRLVMVSLEGCPFCMRWEAQVGHIYPKSSEAKVAPLVRVRFGSDTLAGFKIKYTPTFLVLKGASEIGRIAGYPGADPFWEELGIILKQHGVQTDPKKEVQP